MITEAAILKDGQVYHNGIGARHDAVILSQPLGFFTSKNSTQGFIDETGTFMDRIEAAKHAYECGQLGVDNHYLMSEDLW